MLWSSVFNKVLSHLSNKPQSYRSLNALRGSFDQELFSEGAPTVGVTIGELKMCVCPLDEMVLKVQKQLRAIEPTS